MSESKSDNFCAPRFRDLIIIVAVPALAILATGSTMLFIKQSDLVIIVLALVVTVIGALAGGVVLAIMWKHMPDYLPQSIMAGMAVRMLITLAGIVFFLLTRPNVGLQFLFYTIGFYFAGLVCETVIAVKKLTVRNPR